MRFLPGSLVARTSLLLIVGLAIIEFTGVAMHAMDRLRMTERGQLHEYQLQVFSIYRTVAEAAPDHRQEAIDDLHIPSDITVILADGPDPEIPGHRVQNPAAQHGFRPPPADHPPADHPPEHVPEHLTEHLPGRLPDHPFDGPPPPGGPGGEPPGGPPIGGPPGSSGGPPDWAPHAAPPPMRWALMPSSLFPREIWTGEKLRTHSTSLLLPDGRQWLVARLVMPLPNPFDEPFFLLAFLLTSLCGSAAIVWATRRLIAPVTTLASAAEALGRDVNSTAVLPETGPSEIRRAAIAFNTMALRIHRFVSDRTFILTAIGHDLRTPITRLKLRAEFIEDDELRAKVLADLDEMESMVSATLAFGRDSASNEPIVSLDLRALLQTIMDEAAESHPDQADRMSCDQPQTPVRIRARSIALKRALNNLILNALKYGGGAHVTLLAPDGEPNLRLLIEDDGPGLPEEELERVFDPFVRGETSRNRETGGTGLGLSIARTILRGQGGDVRLENRPQGGLRAVVTLAA